MLGGLAIGLVVALGVYLRQPAPAPEREAAAVPATGPEAAAPAARETPPPAAAESRFEFYEMLPQFEVVIPEYDTDVRADTAPRAVEAPGRYVLQAGSFKTLADADRRQASLALLGVESNIQRVAIENDVFHRVRIGPVEDLARLNEIRRRLRDARIETLLMQAPE